ncbi:unnamed protein product [Cyclocybe aegerita]|uniref:Aegerolysin type hemolysin n=1 Tax=Cyclocybe aegerita TaxID=1973307 RepID=A0A8S0WJV9_CYCAE|nr:unnamed protein product [Cyclocybe aegerita]
MAYAQWVIIILHNTGAKPLKLKNLKPSYGKLHADGDKDKEVYPSEYEGKVLGPDDKLQINACGRSDAAEGTTGDFDLVDPNENDKVIRHFYWDCPWISKTNTWTVSGSNSKWMVEYSGQNLNGGGLGTITVEVMAKGA